MADGKRLSRLVPYVLAACTAISVLSTDLFTPSVPHLPASLGTDINTAQMAVNINLFAYAVAQLAHGPLADRYGRQKLLLVAFGLFATASALCATATTIDSLIVGRFLQGLFSSVPSVVTVLIIRELYTRKIGLRVMAFYGAALGVAPALGPLLGGYLEVYFGWRAGFYLICGLSILVAVLVFWHVPETLRTPKELNFGQVRSDYAQLLKFPPYLYNLAPLSLVFGSFFAFVTTGPVVIIKLLELPTQHYGLCYGIIIAAYVTGSMTAGRWSNTMNAQFLVRLATFIALGGTVLLCLPVLLGYLSLVFILLGMTVFALGLGILMVPGPIVLLDSVAHLPQGPASALLGSCQLGAAGFAGFISAYFYDGNAQSMVLTMFGMVGISGLVVLFQPRRPQIYPA